MCQRVHFICISVFLFLCFKLNAETLPAKYLSFDLLTIKDGLSQGMINTILQDHFGFMWFGTKDGLNRYDGYHFVVYRHDPSDTNSLADNFIQQVFEDSRGWLWVGTSDRGVDLFNRETQTFHHFHHTDNNQNSLGDDRIECITEDHQGAIWITTQNGLNKISIEQNSANAKNISFHVQRYFSGYTRAYMASDGTLWGTAIGNLSFRIYPEKNNHDRIDTLDSSKYFSYPIIDRGFEKFIGAAAEDTVHHILYLISEYSIAAVNIPGGDAQIISTQRNHWGQFGRTICIDGSQKIWLSERDWLEQFDAGQRKWYRILPLDHNFDIMLNNTSVTYRDQSGIIWIGTKGYGVLKFNPRSEKFHKTDDESIGWMSSMSDGRVIINKFGKFITTFSDKTGEYITSINDSSFFNRIKSSSDFGITSSAVADKNGLFWLSKNCLVSYDEQTNQFQQYRTTDLYDFPVFVDHDNKIWMGTENVFSRFDPVTKTFTDYQYPVPPLRLPYDFLQCIYEDSSGIFWLGTVKGLLRFDPHLQSWKQFINIPNDSSSLSYDLIFSLCPDPVQPNKYLWIGMNGGGLNRFDMHSGKVIRYNQKNGLPNDVIYGILSDDQNNLWLSTNNGLSRFNLQTKTFKNFQEKDGLQGNEFNRYAYCKTNDGTLYFGGLNGFNYFRPNDLTDNPFVPQIVITDFKLRNQSVSTKEKNSPLQKPVFITDKIVLPYSENMISFEFASMDFTSPEQNLYRYRLTGFDHDWIQAGNIHSATYTNLNPGTYTFTVLGSNSDGIWNENGKSIQLVILPPWYMTWWFRVAVAVLVVGLLYAFYRYRLYQALKLQSIRNRIAQDLHDEIGSNLSNISIFSAVGKSKVQDPGEADSLFTLIKDYTQTSMEAMGDIVWMINSKNDRFENIIVRMRTLAAETFETTNTELLLNFDERLNEMKLGMEERKNFYLIYKEALNNSAKYAECKKMVIDMKMNSSNVYLVIADDGKGFDVNSEQHGNGLINMKKRAAVLHGKLNIDSSPGNGTILTLQFKIK